MLLFHQEVVSWYKLFIFISRIIIWNGGQMLSVTKFCFWKPYFVIYLVVLFFGFMVIFFDTQIHGRGPERSANQTYSSCFWFRIWWILLEGPYFFHNFSLALLQVLQCKLQILQKTWNFKVNYWSKKYQIILKTI